MPQPETTIKITGTKGTWSYLVAELSGVEMAGCRAFRFTRLDDEADTKSYDVLVSADGHHTCECMGFLRHARCKHLSEAIQITRERSR